MRSLRLLRHSHGLGRRAARWLSCADWAAAGRDVSGGQENSLSTARVMLPDDANVAGNVHGGTILRMIEQAGFVVASRLCQRVRRAVGGPPLMGALAQIFQMSFFLPMYVGELAKLYAAPRLKPGGGIEVVVDVWAENVITGEIRQTNHAVLCYAAVDAETGAQVVPCSDLAHQLGQGSGPCGGPCEQLEGPAIHGAMAPSGLGAFTGCGKAASETSVNLVQLMLPGDCQRGRVVGGGVIMKLMDNAAAVCAVKHCRANVVTVSIDTLTFAAPVLLGDIAHVQARMAFTSAKSMDILVNVKVERLTTQECIAATSGSFSFVSLDTNHRPQAVPAIVPETEQDRYWYALRRQKYEERRRIRQQQQQQQDRQSEASAPSCS